MQDEDLRVTLTIRLERPHPGHLPLILGQVGLEPPSPGGRPSPARGAPPSWRAPPGPSAAPCCRSARTCGGVLHGPMSSGPPRGDYRGEQGGAEAPDGPHAGHGLGQGLPGAPLPGGWSLAAPYPYMSGQFLSMQTLPTRARCPASLHTSASTWWLRVARGRGSGHHTDC